MTGTDRPAGVGIENFSVEVGDLDFVGRDLNRPECVLATASGDIFVADGRGGVAMLRPDGEVRLVLGHNGPGDFIPNGIALLADRSFLIANIGAEGGVWHMAPDGALRPHLLEVEGRRLPPTNFVTTDDVGRVWVTVSTWHVPRADARRKGHADGFVILMDEHGARVVAEGLGFTNEAKVDPSGGRLYVNETIARRLSRFAIRSDSTLGPRETVTEFAGDAMYPDGLTFDAEGGVWVTCVVRNCLVRVHCDTGEQRLVLEDGAPDHVRRAEANFQAGGQVRMDKPAPGRTISNPSSLAFGDGDLRTAYLGTVYGNRIACFRSPVPGAAPPHWRF